MAVLLGVETNIWQKRFVYVFVSAGKILKITFHFVSANAVAGKKTVAA